MRTVVTSFLSHLFFVIVTGISITACEHKGNGEYWLKDDPEFSESLISDYVRVDESNPIQIVPFSDDCFVSSRQLVLIAHVNPFQHDQKLFDTMKRRYDDTHYNGFVSGVVSQRNHSYSNDFTGVDLISDTEYNDLRAGESLGAIVRFYSVSPYLWLKSGSKDLFDWEQYKDPLLSTMTFSPQFYPVSKLLKDLTPEDLKLLKCGSVFLCFLEPPKIKEHHLTLTFFEGESVYQSTSRVVFSEK